MRQRSYGINVRVTAAEKHRMCAAAKKCGLTLSEYLRKRALVHDPASHPPQAFFDALGELDALADILSPEHSTRCRQCADEIRAAVLLGEVADGNH